MSQTAVYRLFDACGALLYVGVGSDIGMRFTSHRATQPWWYEVASISLTYYDTRDDALEAETRAIISENPLHNVAHSSINRMERMTGGAARRRALVRVADAASELEKAVARALEWRYTTREVAEVAKSTPQRIRQIAAKRSR